MSDRREAILLIGPTGSGKTPLGEALAADPPSGRELAHFDFGAALRAAAAGEAGRAGLTGAEVETVRDVLERAALFEDGQWPIAAKLLRAFLADRPAAAVLLNGLPRHVGQAEDVDERVDVRTVIELRCDAATVLTRLRLDPAGDRAERRDDGLREIRRKLRTYAQRTTPLVEHYRARGARTIGVETGPTDTAAELLEKVRRMWDAG
jgi:adenylate kinase family enzyme